MCVSLAVIFWPLPVVEGQDECYPTSNPGIPKFADVNITLSISKDKSKTEYKGNDSDQDSLNVYFHTL